MAQKRVLYITCDKCQKDIPSLSNSDLMRVSVHSTNDQNTTFIDLCPGCYNKFRKRMLAWFPEKKNPRFYMGFKHENKINKD